MDSGAILTEVDVVKSFNAVRYRCLFVFTLLLTLVALMMPGPMIESLRSWVLGWWPGVIRAVESFA